MVNLSFIIHVFLNLLLGRSDYIGSTSNSFNYGFKKFYSIFCGQVTFAVLEILELVFELFLFYRGFFTIIKIDAPVAHNFEYGCKGILLSNVSMFVCIVSYLRIKYFVRVRMENRISFCEIV